MFALDQTATASPRVANEPHLERAPRIVGSISTGVPHAAPAT
jgi:hypothetical protein